ncbi:heat shock protein [Nymphaea thermarum]|nr:heat shock protein [Nymphaea thermarum]
MAGGQAVEILMERVRDPKKWRLSLREDVYESLLSQAGDGVVQKIFSGCSIFSPLLFGKFFDPSDAFPLWDFESESLLSGFNRESGSFLGVDWFEAETDYVLKAELPGGRTNDLQITVAGRIVEISGQWKSKEKCGKDWRCQNWWDCGYVRRLEPPENSDPGKLEAFIDENILEIKIPKILNGESSSPTNAERARDS